MQLKDMTVGKFARIVGISAGEKLYRHKLIAMGLIPGTELFISRIAPLGDPIEIKVRGFALSLRKEEAAILQLEVITSADPLKYGGPANKTQATPDNKLMGFESAKFASVDQLIAIDQSDNAAANEAKL